MAKPSTSTTYDLDRVISPVCANILFLGANAQACDLVRRPAAVYFFLPALLCSPQAAQEVLRQATDLYRSDTPGASDQVLC